MTTLRRAVNRMPLRLKLSTLFLVFGALPIILIGILSYNLFSDMLLNHVLDNLLTEAEKNNELISLRFERIEDVSLYLTANEDLRALLNPPHPPTDLEKLHGNIAIKRILDNAFMGIGGVFSYHLYTDYYMMVGNSTDPIVSSGRPPMYVPYDRFPESSLCKAAVAAKGKLVWYPTYSFESMYGVEEYKEIDYDYHHLFSAVKQINCLDAGEGRAAPVLIVSFKPSFIDSIVSSADLAGKGARYYLVSDDQKIIASSEPDCFGQPLPPQIAALTAGASGSLRGDCNGVDCVVAYHTLKVSGWKQIILVPSLSYLGSMTTIPKVILLVSLLCAGLLTVIVTIITHNISGSMRIVTDGMRDLGRGNFGKPLPIPQDREFGLLASGFNQMQDKIRTLIVENYEIDLRQKEAQLMALNLQMNPHFLYNTLSTVNWIAIENGQEAISQALTHLSGMLQRSYKNKSDVFTVEDDIKWLEDYLYIMKLRFGDKFKVKMNIDERLMKTTVPRCMFQPLIENAIIHGFQSIDDGGLIRIEGALLKDRSRRFAVADNGDGFSPSTVDAILAESSSGVGLSNLNHRLRVLYKDRYSLQIDTACGSGTRITITLPAEPSPNEA